MELRRSTQGRRRRGSRQPLADLGRVDSSAIIDTSIVRQGRILPIVSPAGHGLWSVLTSVFLDSGAGASTACALGIPDASGFRSALI